MTTKTVAELLSQDVTLQDVTVKGWVRTFRANRFIALNDGSTINNIQCVVDFENFDEALLKRVNTGAAIHVTGELVESQGKGQSVEIVVKSLEVLGDSDPETYPIQPKKHSFEFLRENAHLRTRTNTFSAVMRLRSSLSFAIHKYFNDNGFFYMHTPIITGSDAEGAGETFRVTSLDPKITPLNEEGDVNYKEDFFGKETNLTVSGQLEAETYAMSLGKVYTFGPTFRAENSNTSRHLSEFWMVEPEMAFCDLEGNMDLAEEMIKHLTSFILEACNEDIELFAKFVDKTLLKTLNNVAGSVFERLLYADAVKILKKSGKKFKYDIDFGKDLQTEHERYLTEDYFKKPLIVFDYPKNIKPFYMRLNEDHQTVSAMDVLVPRIGEIIGGSQRDIPFTAP